MLIDVMQKAKGLTLNQIRTRIMKFNENGIWKPLQEAIQDILTYFMIQ